MLKKAIYPKVESLLSRIAGRIHQKGFTPDQLTLAGFGVNFLAACLYAGGHLFLGSVTVAIGALGDLLDGPLARLTGQVSKWGAFLDSTLDRYSDFFIFGGLCLGFAQNGHYGFLLLALGTLAGAFVTSYSKARAENLIESCSVGIFERAERVIVIILGTMISPLLPFALWVLFLGTNLTALHRILYVRKQLSS